MSGVRSVSEIARALAEAIELPEKASADVDTRHGLVALAGRESPEPDDLALIDLLSRQIDINGALYSAYSARGRRKSDSKITDPKMLELTVAIMCRSVFLEAENPGRRADLLKRLNTLFKAMDLLPAPWLASGSQLGRELEDLWTGALRDSGSAPDLEVATAAAPVAVPGNLVRLPLTVLFWEGPIARAYLETLHSTGFKPAKIIHLIASQDVATRKPVGRWLPKMLRAPYADQIQRSRIHHWPKSITRSHPQLKDSLLASVEDRLDFSRAIVEAANALSPLSRYCDDVDAVLVKNLADGALQTYLEAEDESAILFTGGGIVPARLLSIPQLRFIHVHPGHLPSIRGADCLLWSVLLTGHPSASCFYMAPGLDTGDIVLPCWLPRISIAPPATEVETKTQYQAAYAYLDPWVRSFALRQVLTQHDGFYDMESTPQNEDSGLTFHFMHERFRGAALEKLFSAMGH